MTKGTHERAERANHPTPCGRCLMRARSEASTCMSDRLRPRDLAFLATESPRTPMHNATVEIFDPGDSGFDYARLVELIADRIAFVPRYRQRLQRVPGRLANPAWVDNEGFDLG